MAASVRVSAIPEDTVHALGHRIIVAVVVWEEGVVTVASCERREGVSRDIVGPDGVVAAVGYVDHATHDREAGRRSQQPHAVRAVSETAHTMA